MAIPMSSARPAPSSVIGGLFGMAERRTGSDPPAPVFMDPGAEYLANARSALYRAFVACRPSRVWLPSFLCPAVIEAVAAVGAEARFYALGEHLQPVDDLFLGDLQPGDSFVFIDFFGFPGVVDLARQAQERGCIVIEDASQALLSSPSLGTADFVCYSPRKFLGVADGGILRGCADAAVHLPELAAPPSDWWACARAAAAERAEFDRKGGENQWFKLFQAAERGAPTGNYRMSKMSHKLLLNAFDYKAIAQCRRANFEVLLRRLPVSAFFKELPEGTVPLGFPIMVDDRDNVQRALAKQKIYAPVHWRISEFVPPQFEASHCLGRGILTLPCDQRCNAGDMQRILGALARIGIEA